MLLSVTAKPQESNSQLPAHFSTEEAAAIQARYGQGAEAALAAMEALEKINCGRPEEADRAAVDAAVSQLALIDAEALGEEERAQLGRAWWKVAELTRRLDGPSEEMLGQLEVALSLAPKEETLAREVDYQRARASAVAARLEQAALIRAARQRGEDPYDGFEERVAGAAGKGQPQN